MLFEKGKLHFSYCNLADLQMTNFYVQFAAIANLGHTYPVHSTSITEPQKRHYVTQIAALNEGEYAFSFQTMRPFCEKPLVFPVG
jgi:hypothetical protein